jgi:hypothetical protein
VYISPPSFLHSPALHTLPHQAACLRAMPRLVYGSHQIYCSREFAEGARSALDEGASPVPAIDFNFSALTAKGVTSMMRNGRLWVPAASKKSVRAYAKLSPTAQRAALYEQGIYQYKGLAEVERAQVEEAEDCDGGSSSDEEMELPPWSERPIAAPDDARRRVAQKTMTGHIDHDVKCVIPTLIGTCRLSEIGKIWSVAWGTSIDQPASLRLWGASPCFPLQLVAIAYRENGEVYYAERPIWHSASALWLVMTGLPVNKFYCRLLLMLSPMVRRISLDGLPIFFTEDERNEVMGIDKAVDDGMARFSKTALVSMNLWDGVAMVYHAFQFRAVTYSAGADRTALVKGMGKYVASLKTGIEFPTSTRKAESKGLAPDVPLYLDITGFTGRAMSQPSLNGSVAAALKLGVAMLPDDARADAEHKWKELVSEAKKGTFEALVRKCWALPAADELPVHIDLIHKRPETVDEWPALLIPQENIDILPIAKAKKGASHVDTPMADLLMEKEVVVRNSILHRRKESLCIGRGVFWGTYKRLEKNPKVFFPGFGCTVTCLVDTSGTLRASQCYVISNGRSLSGECGAFRCPMALPTDMEEWLAIPVPTGLVVEDNCVVVSAEGHGVSRMAGGDYDGDLVMIVFCSIFVSLIRAIAPALADFNFEQLRSKLEAELGAPTKSEFRETSSKGRLKEYLSYGESFRNDQLRGRVTALAERAAMHTLIGDTHRIGARRIKRGALRQESIVRALSFGMCTHFATDVPKHYTSDQVWVVVDRLLLECGFRKRDDRSSVVCASFLRLFETSILKRQVIDLAEEQLTTLLGGRYLGAYWLPEKNYVLGFAAGRRVARILLTMPHGEAHHERSAVRTVIGDIARLINHRLHGKLLQMLRDGDLRSVNCAILLCQKGVTKTLGTLERSLHA